MIESPAALRLLAALAEIGAAGATREHLVRKANLGTTTFYRLIVGLVEKGFVRSAAGRFQIAFENPYCFRFKLWQDMERLQRLAASDRDLILTLSGQIRGAGGPSLQCLWLVGSAARGELSADSDLDFLLVSRDGEATISSSADTRKVSVVQMSEAEFRAAHGRADSFVVSALQEGIVLLDREFVQEFYRIAPAVRLAAHEAAIGDQTTSDNEQRLRDQVARDDVEAAQRTIRAQAVHVGRLMLRIFGELPPSRSALVQESERYFGADWSALIEEAAVSPPASRAALVSLNRRISEWHETFQIQATHLQRFASLPNARGRDLEGLVELLLREFAPEASTEPSDDPGFDLQLRWPDGKHLLVEVKSSTGTLSPETYRQVVAGLESARAHLNRKATLLIVVNELRDLPPSERRESERADWRREQVRSDRILVVSVMQLLRAHNRLHLEQRRPGEILEALLEEGRIPPAPVPRRRKAPRRDQG